VRLKERRSPSRAHPATQAPEAYSLLRSRWKIVSGIDHRPRGGHRDLESALAAYEQERKTALLLLQREARNSARWFESLPRYIRLGEPQFAALLHHRRSQLLTRMSPASYYRLRRTTELLPLVDRLWHSASGRGRARYVRRTDTA
jgi:hypothetical protein